MKRILMTLITAMLISVSVFANDTVTYDFADTIVDENTVFDVPSGVTVAEKLCDIDSSIASKLEFLPSDITINNGFHPAIWFGKLSATCTLGMPVTYTFDNVDLEGYKTASFGLTCQYVDNESVLEVKTVTESGKEEVSVIPLETSANKMYTVKLPETNEKIVKFEIFVNSIPEDNSMFDVELDFVKFHKSQSLMLLSIGGEAVHDGVRSMPSSPAVIRNGSTLTPARFVAESFGAKVEWIASERKVIITKNGITIELVIDSKTALVNGVEKELAMPACIIDNYTYTPARFVAENLGCTVDWDGQTKTVFIGE